MIKRFGKRKLYNISNIYSIISNSIGVLLKNTISPLIMITNSIFSTEVIQMDIEQSLYNSKYRASMGSIKSLIKNILFSILALALGEIADLIGVIYALVIFQIIKIIPIIIYNNIIKNIEIA